MNDRRPRIADFFCFLVLLGLFVAPPQQALAQGHEPQNHEASPWLLGFYVGALDKQRFIDIPTQPWTVRLEPSFIGAFNVTFVAHRFESLPIDLEVDGVLAKRFGRDDEWEAAVVPMVRWKAFPWNDYLYTTFRLGLIGASYVSDVSPWELKNSHTATGSRFLNFLVPELTFSSGPAADWETFLRVHHRSGGYGTINGVYGGSNYVSVGYRRRL